VRSTSPISASSGSGGAEGRQRELVERLLSDAFGATVAIATWERIEPWFVVRCAISGGRADVPPSVIVKSLREHPENFRTDPVQVATERAALEFMADHVPELAPRLVASDLDACVLVLEDVAPRVPLWDLLVTNAPGAEDGLTSFAGALGQIGARTAGLHDEYNACRRAYGHVDPRAVRQEFVGHRWTETRGFTEGLGVALSQAAERDVEAVFEALDEPGPFLAFSNGDAGANNYLVDGTDGRFIDFEFAGFRHALCDAKCLYVPGSMWMTVGDPIAEGHEEVYRGALSDGIAEATDDRLYGTGLAAACVGFAMERLHRVPRIDAREPGHQSHLQMITTLEAAARTANIHHALPDAAGWLIDVSTCLRRRWPDADVDTGALGRYATRE
jgi:hypothetical protein